MHTYEEFVNLRGRPALAFGMCSQLPETEKLSEKCRKKVSEDRQTNVGKVSNLSEKYQKSVKVVRRLSRKLSEECQYLFVLRSWLSIFGFATVRINKRYHAYSSIVHAIAKVSHLQA